MKIVVDSNILFSALIKDSKTREILLESNNEFFFPSYVFYEALKHVMGRVFQFSTKVVEVDHRERYLHTSGGTMFDSVAKHMIKEQVRCAIIFSDGMSHISPTHMDTLKRQIEHLVYIKIKENEYKNWEHLATDTIYLLKKEAS